jgi:acylphosphatase
MIAATRFMKKQIHVYYTGRVQGVGFRFTAQDLARDLGVCGWAKNLRNGQVEVVAEAEEEVLKDFLARVRQYFDRHIQNADVDWLPATGEFKEFGIEF